MRSIIANKSHQDEFNIWVMKNWSELVFFKMYGYVRDLHNRVVIYCIWSALRVKKEGSGLIMFGMVLGPKKYLLGEVSFLPG